MKILQKILLRVSLPIYVFLYSVTVIYAAENPPCLPGKICNPIPGITSVGGLIQTFLVGALKIGLPIITLAVIYCGFLFVAAQGNSEKLSKAKDALLYTLIGAGILLGSWAIAELISSTVTSL